MKIRFLGSNGTSILQSVSTIASPDIRHLMGPPGERLLAHVPRTQACISSSYYRELWKSRVLSEIIFDLSADLIRCRLIDGSVREVPFSAEMGGETARLEKKEAEGIKAKLVHFVQRFVHPKIQPSELESLRGVSAQFIQMKSETDLQTAHQKALAAIDRSIENLEGLVWVAANLQQSILENPDPISPEVLKLLGAKICDAQVRLNRRIFALERSTKRWPIRLLRETRFEKQAPSHI